MPIQILSDQTISQIAAGEVVERPASVVKELLENALDAGATQIHVSISGGGRKLIRVSDNGSGIPQDEVLLAFTRHATSKLLQINDLPHLSTLGFRGEALASIASVSRIEVVTRHRDEELGTRLKLEGGKPQQNQSAGAPVGTIVAVEDLFFNTPARLKFMKKETTEQRNIVHLMTRYAMAYPDVRFIVESEGRELFRSTGSGEVSDVLVRVLGLDSFRMMVEISSGAFEDDTRLPIKVSGFTSYPEYNRSDRTQITLFVNGRWIQDSSLTYAITQAYHTHLDAGRYPVAVVMIELPREEVDINVHPAKAEVRFRNQEAVFAAVQRAIRQGIVSTVGIEARQPAHLSDRFTQTSFDFDQGTHHIPRMRFADTSKLYTPQDDDADSYYDDPTAIPEGMGAPKKPRTLPMLRVVGQVGASYIVAEGPSGMYLIDQHAAHRRVLYEQIREQIKGDQRLAATETDAITLEFSTKEGTQLLSFADTFTHYGIEMEAFGPGTVIIRSMPDILLPVDMQKMFSRFLASLSGNMSDDSLHELIQRIITVYAAVREGEVLTHEDMQSLVRQLERMSNPFVCPEGQPTLIHMSGDQIARQFDRS